ncbi:MAG: putative hydroxypyruvate isomerase, partial [Frankiales bacterium]|nr:putative hydroxypyruvate isomerase [Frankiales bacterium]
TGVEFWSVPATDVESVVAAAGAHRLTVTSVNAGTGAGPDAFGLMGIPGAEDQWRREVVAGLEVARRLSSRAVNLLVGGRVASATRTEQLDCLLRNLDWCLNLVGEGDPLLLIEPLNSADRRSPLIRTVADAESVLDSVGRPAQAGLLFDAYHLHQEEADLHEAFDRARPLVRHIQIADHPGRGAPGTGRLPVRSFLAQVVASGYDGWVGCELVPSTPEAVASIRAGLADLLTPAAVS